MTQNDQSRVDLRMDGIFEGLFENGILKCLPLAFGLSLEEVIACVRNRQPSVEIMRLKVLGKVEVLSSSEHLV
jgi:hypothetical protein